jgi:hypothetical protein
MRRTLFALATIVVVLTTVGELASAQQQPPKPSPEQIKQIEEFGNALARQPMTGAKRYTITFKEPMHYIAPLPPSFWSITMYDGVTRFTVPNPIGRYSLGSDDDIHKNADGSFTLNVQHDNPGPDKESNWLPAPDGPF